MLSPIILKYPQRILWLRVSHPRVLCTSSGGLAVALKTGMKCSGREPNCI